MADPYYRYSAIADRGVNNYAGYLSSASASAAAAPPQLASSSHVNEFRDVPSDFLRREITPNPMQPVPYGLDNSNNNNNGGIVPVISGAITGSSGKGYPSPSLIDPCLPSYRGEASVNVTTSAIPDMMNDRPSISLRINGDGPSVSRAESNILFVDGLPTDCTRREVGHLFRPFIGYKDIKVIHKEPRQSRDKAMVFCFVEFGDAKCAFTAMEALQGYKFDDKKPNSSLLRIQFAHFPFRPPHDHDEQRIGIPR